MEVKSRNFNVFYTNAPKEVYIRVNKQFNIDTFKMQQLISLLSIELIKKNKIDVEQNYFIQHFFVAYFEYEKQNKRLIIYYELKQEYYKSRYKVYEKSTLFPNNLIVFAFK
jgi:hypothetical protein